MSVAVLVHAAHSLVCRPAWTVSSLPLWAPRMSGSHLVSLWMLVLPGPVALLFPAWCGLMRAEYVMLLCWVPTTRPGPWRRPDMMSTWVARERAKGPSLQVSLWLRGLPGHVRSPLPAQMGSVGGGVRRAALVSFLAWRTPVYACPGHGVVRVCHPADVFPAFSLGLGGVSHSPR